MKKSLIIVFTLFSFVIKAQQNKPNKNVVTTIIGEIDKRDLNCSSEIEKAKNDFKSKETFYDIKPEGYLTLKAKRHYPFLVELLKKKNIDFAESTEAELSSFWYESNGMRYQLKTNCHCKTYNELLNLKYGSHFIKDIQKTADSLYVINRLNSVFNYPEEIDDYFIVYPKAKDFFDQKVEIQKDFFANFKFPKGFIQGINKRDFFAKTDFLINRDTKISNINIDIEFTNSENQKFKDYITSQLREFIENANWNAAVSSGVKVDCRFNMNFYN